MPLPENRPALIGAAGEAFVAAELMRRGAHVSIPSYDRGIDLVAHHEHDLRRSVPIQVKAASNTGYSFERAWLDRGVALVHVWHVWDAEAAARDQKNDQAANSAIRSGCGWVAPQFYIFANLAQVENALGPYANSPSWTERGKYSVTKPKPRSLALGRMREHLDRWDRILDQLEGQ